MLAAPAPECTPLSHAEAKRTLDPILVFKGFQLDDDDQVVADCYDCSLCGSTLYLKPAPPEAPPRRRHVRIVTETDIARAADRDIGRALELDQVDDRRIAEALGARICQRRGLVDIAVFTENRQPRVVVARRELCEVLRHLGWTLPRIGRAVGRHHTSVLHLLQTAAAPVHA